MIKNQNEIFIINGILGKKLTQVGHKSIFQSSIVEFRVRVYDYL